MWCFDLKVVDLALQNRKMLAQRPLRLVAQDTGFSSQQQGFDSPRGRQLPRDSSLPGLAEKDFHNPLKLFGLL